MLDDPQMLDTDTEHLHQQLLELPYSYAGAQKILPSPYGAMGFGEGALPLRLSPFMDKSMVISGTQFVLGDVLHPDGRDIAHIAEASGANVVHVGTAKSLHHLDALVPTHPLSTYSYMQYLAYATGHDSEAKEADAVLSALAERCQASVSVEENPAKQLAWTLWGRTAVLLCSSEFSGQMGAWQQLLGRVGKSMSIAVEYEALITLSGGFEARHNMGDGLVGLILGKPEPETALAEEILSTRIDEVHHIVPPEASLHAQHLYLWYLGAWVAFYVALSYQQNPADSKIMQEINKSTTPEPEVTELN